MKQQKMTAKARLVLANLAKDRLVETELRAVETLAETALVDVMFEKVRSFPEKERDYLATHGLMSSDSDVQLPQFAHREVEKTFRRPDGEVVKRGSRISIPFTYEPLQERVRFDTGQQINEYLSTGKPAAGRYTISGCRRLSFPSVKLPYCAFERGLRLEYERNGSFVIRGFTPPVKPDAAKVEAALVNLYLARKARFDAETELLKGMLTFILEAKTFQEVTAFWPEALEKELQLFGPQPQTFALVALSQDTRSKLCANMQKRGVQSDVCSVAA